MRRHREREVDASSHRLFADASRGKLRVLLTYGRRDVARCQAELGQHVGTQPDPDRVVLRAEDLHVSHAGNTAQFVNDVQQRVVRNEDGVEARIVGVEREDLQERGRALAHLHALSSHFLRQRGEHALHAIVDVDRGEVRVGANRERHGHRQRAVARARRAQVKHAVDAIDRLVQRCRNGLRDGLGIGPRVERLYVDFGRQDVRILRDRQHTQGREACNDDERRDDRRENRSLDEVTRDHLFAAPPARGHSAIGDLGCVVGNLRL